MDLSQKVQYIKTELSKLLNQNIVVNDKPYCVCNYRYVSSPPSFMLEFSDDDTSMDVDLAFEFVKGAKLRNVSVSDAVKSTQVESQDNITEKMKQAVLHCIDTLKNDPKFIPQANAINAQIQTLINIKKVEIDSHRLKMDMEKQRKQLS